MTKAQLRKEIGRQRRQLSAEWIGDASRRIIERLCGMAPLQAAQTIALYKAIAFEVNLEGLFSRCWNEQKHTCIPVFDRDRNRYDMAEIDVATPFSTGNYGIQEPIAPKRVALGGIDLIVVPGVAFDSAGNRLGRGGGYYDRLLDGFAGTTVAVTFDFQLLSNIPCDAHDIPVEYIVTESKIVKVQNEH